MMLSRAYKHLTGHMRALSFITLLLCAILGLSSPAATEKTIPTAGDRSHPLIESQQNGTGRAITDTWAGEKVIFLTKEEFRRYGILAFTAIFLVTITISVTWLRQLKKQVRKKTLQLEEARATLEEKVRERTEELSKELFERRRIEEKLLQHEMVLSDILEDTLSGFWEWNLKDNTEYFSPAFKKMLGYEDHELPNSPETWQNLIFTEDLPGIEKVFRRHVKSRGRKPFYNEVRYRHKDGSTIWVICAGRVIEWGTDRSPIRMVGCHVDITDLKNAEEKIKKQQYYLEKAQEIGEIGTWELDIESSRLNWTDQNYRIFGLPPGTPLTYELFLECVHPDDSEFVHNEWSAALKGKPYDIEHRVVSNGRTLWVREKADITFDGDGKAIYAIGFTQDITERITFEQEQRKMHKLESIGILAGGIAHDFNNLLSGIQNNIYLSKIYQESNRQEKALERLASAEKAVNRATGLTHQLLTFSRGGSPVKKTASIQEIIIESAEFALKGSKIKCEVNAQEDLTPVEIDEGQISQVVHNLILNAAQSMPAGGTIDISAQNISIGHGSKIPLKEGDYLKVAVRDQGTGIENEIQTKLFDPYFSTKDEGRGLGLSITYSIIQKHDGYITFESKLGSGTTFTFYLPASHQTAEKKEENYPAISGGNGRVLIMDDEELIRESVSQVLSHSGYTVRCAKNGEEAINLYRSALEESEPYDAVILDLTVRGGMGGQEAIKRLLKLDPDVSAIVSSGYSNDAVLSNFREYGFSGIYAKHERTAELFNTLQNIINH